MQYLKKMAWLTLALAAFGPPARGTEDLMSSQLVDQARHWQQKDRDDIAADLWRKLLRTDPGHPEALVKLGVIEARAGNIKEAMTLYNQANQLTKQPAGLSQLSAVLKAVQDSSKNLPPPAAKQEPDKSVAESVEKTVKIDTNKRIQTKPPPPAAKSNQNMKPQLNSTSQDTARPNERSAITGSNDLKLKSETSIDLRNLVKHP